MVHEITSTIDWCEDNWVYHDEVAEWWNTVSSLFYIGLPLLGIYNACKLGGMQLKIEFVLNAICRMMVGIGTAWFHGRLTYAGQMYDEIWMLIMLGYGAYQLNKKEYPNIGYLFALPVITFSYFHIYEGYVKLFQCTFLLAGILLHTSFCLRLKSNTAHWSAKKKQNIERASLIMALVTIFGCSLWLTEELFCKSWYKAIFDPHLHAFFHLLTAYSLHGYTVIFHLLLAKEEGYFAYKFGFFPYVSTQPSASGKLMKGKDKRPVGKAA